MKILASTIVHKQDFQSRYWWWSLQVNSVLEVLSEHQTRLSCDSYESDIGKVWDAGLVLIEYLTLHSDLIAKPKKVIELGSGTGLVGIGAAMLGSKCIVTDMEEVRIEPHLQPSFHIRARVRIKVM